MRVLVTGAGGFLGGSLVPALINDDGIEVFAGFRQTAVSGIPGRHHVYCDFTIDEVINRLLDELRPDVIVHLGAMSSPGVCEKDMKKAASTNGADVLVKAAKKYCPDSLVIFSSTDLVYDGEKGLYRADEGQGVGVNPGNAYAKTKRAGEKAVLSLKNSVVLRLSNMIGKGNGKFLDFLVGALLERKTIGLRKDEIRSFVSLSDVVELIRRIILDKRGAFSGETTTRVFNVGGPEPLSRLQLGQIVARHFGVSLMVAETKEGRTSEVQDEGVWTVFEQSNREAIETSGIFNPRDVSMDSSVTEAFFALRFQSMETAVAEIFKDT
jgi:dTDP-4-dehydrorhamnose reductase